MAKWMWETFLLNQWKFKRFIIFSSTHVCPFEQEKWISKTLLYEYLSIGQSIDNNYMRQKSESISNFSNFHFVIVARINFAEVSADHELQTPFIINIHVHSRKLLRSIFYCLHVTIGSISSQRAYMLWCIIRICYD